MRVSAVALCLLAVTPFRLPAQSLSSTVENLRTEMDHITRDARATVGVAFLHKGKLFSMNDTVRFPLMSVYKLPIAVATLRKMERTHATSDTRVTVQPHQWAPDTYSPMREAYRDSSAQVRLGALLYYCVAESDNNAADILTDYVGGMDSVGMAVSADTVNGFHLSETEADMHKDPERVYLNWAYPSSMVRLVNDIYDGKLLDSSSTLYLEQLLKATQTGTDKMRAGLPAHVQLGHKTGSSDRNAQGIKAGDNDLGVIYLPDGSLCYAAVFIKNSAESDRKNAEIIAALTRCIYHYVLRN